jgi:hypothetical protein
MTPIQIRVFFADQHPISIADLFDFEKEKQSGAGELWTQGVKNYREEMEFYDLLARVDGNETEKGPEVLAIDVDSDA